MSNSWVIPIVATSSIYVNKLWQNDWHAEDLAQRGYIGAGVLLTGGGRARQ